MIKKAFTLIEIIFVVVIIGILSAIIAPRVKRATLDEAAQQIASHIRYTQHLALQDDKFDASDQNWSQKRWQIFFANTTATASGGSNTQQMWTYTIFSDINKDKSPQNPEVAKNPQNPYNSIMTGGYGGNIPYFLANNKVNPKIMKNMNLTKKYDITTITFSGGCINNHKRISFDYSGRPLFDTPTLLTQKYAVNGNNKLLQTDCNITIQDSQGKTKTIVVTPETGYVYIQ